MPQVHLDERDAYDGMDMWVGATAAAPDTLTLPSQAYMWISAVAINKDSVHMCGSAVSENSYAVSLLLLLLLFLLLIWLSGT